MTFFWIALGYLAGSFPTGFLAARLVKGVDIRAFGSGNVGATNVGFRKRGGNQRWQADGEEMGCSRFRHRYA